MDRLAQGWEERARTSFALGGRGFRDHDGTAYRAAEIASGAAPLAFPADGSWSTVGVSENVVEASWSALVDAIRLELMRLTEQDDSVERAVEDYCWGV